MRNGQEGPGIDRNASLILGRPRERWFGRSQLLNGFWPWEHQGDAQWFSVARCLIGLFSKYSEHPVWASFVCV